MLFKILVLLLFIFSINAYAVDYCIHPAGTQTNLSNCIANAGPTCSGAVTSCSINTANIGMQAGDRALLMGGNYSNKIRPTNEGTDHNNRITYQAYDETNVIFTNCSGSAAAEGEGGAINLDLKEWISILGRPPNSGSGAQRIQVQPTVRCGTGLSACGARYGIISDIIVESCQGEFVYTASAVNAACANKSISRVANFCMLAFTGQSAWSRPTEYMLVENSSFIGNLDGSQNSSHSSYDNFTAERGARNIVFRNNLFNSAVHANLKLSDGQGWGHAVIGNRLSGYWHTGLTLYQAGKNNIERNRANILFEDNYITSTWETPTIPYSNAGHTIQVGGGPLLRYNVIAEANNKSKTSSAHNSIGASFGESGTVQQNSCGGIYAYHNSFVNSGGSGLNCNNPGWTPGSSHQSQFGLSYFANNIYYNTRNVRNNRIFDYSNPQNASIVNLDRYINNKIGIDTSPDYNGVFHVMGSGSALVTAVNNWDGTDQSRPIVSDWEGFSNEYIQTIGTWFVDYNNKNYNILGTSPAVDAGAPLTKIASSDSGIGSIIDVEWSRIFWSSCSDYNSYPWMGISCDRICIGSDSNNITTATCNIQITSVDHVNSSITVSSSPNRNPGDYVWVQYDSQGIIRIQGNTSDIGAFESSGVVTTPPTISEITAIPTPTSNLTNDFTFSITDPDNFSFTLSWTGGCSGPTSSNTTGNQTVQVTVAADGIYNCTLTANDGSNNSNTLNLTQFEVITFSPKLSMDLADWQRYSAPEDSLNITDDMACPVANGTSPYGTSIEIGPYLAGQFNTCRLQYRTKFAGTEILVRGYYKAENMDSWTPSVDVCYYVASVREYCKQYKLPRTSIWTQFEKIFYNPFPGTEELEIRFNLSHRAESLSQKLSVADVEYDLNPPAESYPSNYGAYTRIVPQSRQGTGKYEMINVTGNQWHIFDPSGNPIPPTVGPVRSFGASETALMQDTYNKLIAQNWSFLKGTRQTREMAEYAVSQGTRIMPFFASSSSNAVSYLEKEDGDKTGGSSHEFPDPFDPAFATHVAGRLSSSYNNIKGTGSRPNPLFFISFQYDNELLLGNGDLYRYVYSTHANAAFISYLQGLYPTIAELNTAWNTSFSSYTDIFTQRTDPELMDPTDQMWVDWRNFEPVILAKYFEVIKTAMDNQFVDGEIKCSPSIHRAAIRDYIRWASIWKDIFDCMPFNVYPRWHPGSGLSLQDQQSLDDVYNAIGKPIIIHEYSVPSMDSGLYNDPNNMDHSFNQVVDTQENRARRIAMQAMGYANVPYIVGIRYFRWHDYDIANAGDTRNANRGFYQYDSVTPYQTVIDRMTALNGEIFSNYSTTTCPQSAGDGPYTFNAAICVNTQQNGRLFVGKTQNGPFNDACGQWQTTDCVNDVSACGASLPWKCTVDIDGIGTGIDYWFQWQSPTGIVIQEDSTARRIP